MSGEFGKWEKVPQKLRIRQKLMDTNKAREHQQRSKFEPTITSTSAPLSMTKFSAFTIQQEQLAQQARAKQLALAKREKKLQEMQRMASKQPVRPKKQPRPKKTPQQAADSIDLPDLVNYCIEAEQRYPNHQDIQLQKLAEYFEKKYQLVSLGKKQEQRAMPFAALVEGPYSCLRLDIKHHVARWIFRPDVSVDTISDFFWFLVSTLISVENKTHMSRDLSGVGLRVLLQSLMKRSPVDLLRKNMAHIKEAFFNEEKGCFHSKYASTFLWLSAQLIEFTPAIALSHWFEFYLPLLSKSPRSETHIALQRFVLEYVQLLKDKPFPQWGHISTSESMLISGFERVLFIVNSAAPPPLLVELAPAIFGMVHFLCHGNGLFLMLLSHASEDAESLRTTVLQNLVEYLAANPNFGETWLLHYPKTIAESNNLMLFVTSSWDSLRDRISGEELCRLALEFIRINNQILVGQYVSGKSNTAKRIEFADIQDINMCTLTCKTLMRKLKVKSKTPVLIKAAALLTPGFLLAAAYYNCCVDALIHGVCPESSYCPKF